MPTATRPTRRRALLIGVDRTDFLARDPVLADRYAPLACATRDVELVGSALSGSGYEVESLHSGHDDADRRHPTRGAILHALEEFFRACSPGDTAFVYLSCHGVSIRGRDYIVPSDAQFRSGDSTLIAKTLVETAPEDLLDGVPEGVTVVVCLDTCRTDAPAPADRQERTEWTGPGYENVLWLRSSGRGQPAYADPDKGSYFGLALSEALSPHSPPQTFGEVHAFVASRIGRLTAHLTEPAPTVEPTYPKGRGEAAVGFVLCKGSQETLRWSDALTRSALWSHTSGDPAVHERVKDRLRDLASEVAKSRLGTDSALDTPWYDPEYPIRVVDRLGLLVEQAALTGHERLSPAETAALLAAPLMHEGAVAVALSELAALRPDRLDRLEEGRGRPTVTDHDQLVCDAARDVCRAHSQVSLAAETLRRRRLSESATAADHWLRHRFIADWDRLWDRTGDYTAIDRLLDMVIAAVAAGAEGTALATPSPKTPLLIDRQLRQVLPHMTVAPGSSPRINDTNDPRWSDSRTVRGNKWRGWDLAYLLWLASLLAADPRRMSSVLVDHLGAHRPLDPGHVVHSLADFDLEPVRRDADAGPGTEYGLAVSFRCPHPALHAAMEELSGTADASVRALHQRWKEARTTPPDLLRGVPQKVTTEFLEPLDSQYTKPLERFRLAEDEIRPLLMGTQLYGDKMLAVRELYQNALDACRHRGLRVEYGGRMGRPDTGWRAEIRFTQGFDDEGRPYIECEDNGTGMSRKKLTSMFARAGKRYEQDPDFVQERRNWRRAKIDPVPFNSRFGIGVFGYFMLAEEVVVSTSAVDLHGVPSREERPLQATVQSGSGLLQIRPSDDAPSRGGTRVRLYLSAHDEVPPSLVETLRSLLWVSDHEVKAVELDRAGNEIRTAEWTPGELQAPTDWPASALKAGPGAWIVQGQGQLLLDGVLVKNAPPVHGFVVNLREKHQPVPTVDRNGLLSYDRKAVDEELFSHLQDAAARLDKVSLRWLWDLTEREPRLAVELLGTLPEGTTGQLETTHDEHSVASTHIPFRRVGCLPFDSQMILRDESDIRLDHGRRGETHLLRLWRWSALGLVTRHRGFMPDGYPLPEGMDALLFLDDLPGGGWSEPTRAAALAEVSLGRAVRALRRYAITGIHVPATDDIRALRGIQPTSVMADLSFAYENAERARTGPIGIPRRIHGGRLANPAAHAPLLAVSTQRKIPPSDALPALRELALVDPAVPDPTDLEQAPLDSRFSEAECLLFVASRRAAMARADWNWLGSEVTPLELLYRAPSPGVRRRLVELLTALEPLGFRLRLHESAELLTHRGLRGAELRLLSLKANGRRPLLQDCHLEVHELVHRAAFTGLPLGLAAEQIDKLSPVTGVTVAEIPREAAEWTPPSWLVPDFPGDAPFMSPIGPWRLLALLQRTNSALSGGELESDLAMFKACGALSPACADIEPELVAHARELPPVLLDLLSLCYPEWSFGRDCRWDLDVSGPDPALLMDLAARRSTTLGEVVDQLREFSSPLPLELPDVPEECRDLAPSYREVSQLQDDDTYGERQGFPALLPLKQILTCVSSAQPTLASAVAAIRAYQPLGGPALPGPFTGPDAEALEDFVPDGFDLAAFDAGLLGPGTLGPLELVLVAGRFGWSLGTAYERYAPFRCLGLDVTVPELDADEVDIVPDWRDVILLTTQLTGRAPALAGTVDPEHVVLCAEETDLDEAGVLVRLRRYARLFAIEVPTPPGDCPA
ncbi:caspase family protein [Streptomyces sp. NPDC046316]|uniref:HD domain-containing protein n=1 Tax=Streptomyces sp. NPDC046316 TaxID=3154494 RepID=UPI003406D6C3